MLHGRDPRYFSVCLSFSSSTPPRADRRGKTPDPALGGVCTFLRPQHSHYRARSIRARGPLLWLQWPWPGGKGGVIIGQLVFFFVLKKKITTTRNWFLKKCFYWFAWVCFLSVKSRPGQSSLSTGSSWTSAGPSIVSSPAWTGHPRSTTFCNQSNISEGVHNYQNTSILKNEIIVFFVLLPK